MGERSIAMAKPWQANEFAFGKLAARKPRGSEGKRSVRGKRSIARAKPWQANEFAFGKLGKYHT